MGIWLRNCLLLCAILLMQGVAQAWETAPVNGPMTSPFGWRIDPITGGSRFHAGIDIAASTGMPVYAMQPGMVAFSGVYGGYGNVVVLDHGRSLYTLYGHNSQLLVRPGETVYAGQPIALAGSTGRSTGPHLHFEVHFNGQYVNPLDYLAQFRTPMLAQASGPPVPSRAATETQTSAPTPQTRTVRQSRRPGKVVQLLNGTHVETIAF